MVVAFENKDLRELCENEDFATKKMGVTKLQDRLADLFAATNVRDLLAGEPREVEYGKLQVYKIDIEPDYVLFFTPNHLKIPSLKGGGVDWDKVNRIKILAIERR